MPAVVALWICCIAAATSTSTTEEVNLITSLRERIENNQFKFQRGFQFQKLCDSGIAMYTKSRGFWKCKMENDCPFGYDCTRSKNGSRVCCPTTDLCPNGCPISNSTGIWACLWGECPARTTCGDTLLRSTNSKRAAVCCMNEICENGLPQLDAFNPYPVLHHCFNTQDCRDGFTCEERSRGEEEKGICCPDRHYPRTLTPEEREHFERLLKENEEKIKRRKSFRRDLSIFYPLIGIPSILLGLTCYFYIKDEFERRDEEQRVREFLARRKRRAQRMKSAEIKESEFQNKGVLKLSEEIGEIKHALEDESSFSLSSVTFEPKYNEIVLIGSEVENLEPVSEERTQSSSGSKTQDSIRRKAKGAELSDSKKSKGPASSATEQKSTKTILPERSVLISPKSKSFKEKSSGKTSTPSKSVQSKTSTPPLESMKNALRQLKAIPPSISAKPTVATDTLRRRKDSQMGQAKSSQAQSTAIPPVSTPNAKRYVGKFVEPNIDREIKSDDSG